MTVLNPPCPTCGRSLATTVKVIDKYTKVVACICCGNKAIVQKYDNQEIDKNSPETHNRRQPGTCAPWLRKEINQEVKDE